MELTVYAQCALRVDFLGIGQEGVVDDGLRDVAFHVGGGSLLSLRVDHVLDDFERSGVSKAIYLARSVGICCAIVAALGAALLNVGRCRGLLNFFVLWVL